jgi:hypothetical protein
VLAPRPAPRVDRAARPPQFFAPPATPSETPFAREARRREPAAEPAPAPVVEAPAPAPEPPVDDAVVRVRFERVADQLPAGVFTLPLDRVAEGLREPHWLIVPRRLVVAQLSEGAVQVEWAVVASQFPTLALAITDIEFRRRYPDLKLTLPMDDLLRQLPRGVLETGGAPTLIPGLDAFPPPFRPLAAPRDAPEPSASPAGDAPDLPPGLVVASPAATPAAAPVPVAPAPSPVAPPAPAPFVPPVPAPVVAPVIVEASATVVAPPPPIVTAAPPIVPIAPPAVAPLPVAAVVEPPAAPSAPVLAPPEVLDRDTLARLAACFAGAGTFESWSGVTDGVALVAFLAPILPRDSVMAVAARVAGLLGAAAGEQVTVRTAHAAIVVSAAPTPVVVAARRPGAPVALLELRGARAAALVGRAGEGRALPERALSAVPVEPGVADVAGVLGAFGDVEPAVLADARAGARVYVFRERGREAEHLGALALAAWEGLARTRDAALGALVSIVFGQGRRRILVRPLDSARGTVLLAAAGPVAHPGRAWRAADRAAAALGAR